MKTLRVIVPVVVAALSVSFLAGCCSKGSGDSSPAAPSASAAASKGPDLSDADNWDRRVHEEKGFAFYIPKGSEEKQDADGTTTLYLATFPPPQENVRVIIAAVKERAFGFGELKTLYKQLLELSDTGKNHAFVEEQKLNDSFVMVGSTYENEAGEKQKVRALLALDVTDRYIVIAVTDAKNFAAREDDIDKVLANFEMVRSGKGSAGDEPKRAPARRPPTAGGGGGGPTPGCEGKDEAYEQPCPLAPSKSGQPRNGVCVKERCVDRCGPGKTYQDLPNGHTCADLD